MQKQLTLAVVAVTTLLVVFWLIRVEADLAELQQRLSKLEPSSSFRKTPSAASSEQLPGDTTQGFMPPASSFIPGFSHSSQMRSRTRAGQSSGTDEQVALREKVAELESVVSELGQAWNQFADEEERIQRKSQNRSWSPGQAVGAPDTTLAGDLPTAWASLDPDGGMEWLQTQYAQPVEVSQVHVRETHNPGAVVKITGVDQAGAEVVLWQGNEPLLPAPADQVFDVRPGVVVGSVRVHLDTRKVPGWNEIDAVELVGRDGTRQWANDATASSTYANINGTR